MVWICLTSSPEEPYFESVSRASSSFAAGRGDKTEAAIRTEKIRISEKSRLKAVNRDTKTIIILFSLL